MAKKIYCLAECFYQFDLETFLFGGGERWFYDFINLLKSNGYDTQCFQFSYDKGTASYMDLCINGLGNVRRNSPNAGTDYLNGYNQFIDLAEKDKVDGVFYLAMDLCYAEPRLKSLSVSHGLTFDGKWADMPEFKFPINALAFMMWVKNSHKVISVDTNSIKVMQVLNPDFSEKMSYIPNYVDLSQFYPSDNWLNNDRFRVLFARRLQWCKGHTFMMEATEKLLNKYDDIEITFCGKGSKEDTEYFMHWYNNQDKERVKYFYKDMSEMPEVYRNADLCVVPTVMAEGTSLSCIEGLAAGVPQVVTWVGGLTDVILQGYNGIIIPPKDSDAIVEAISELYEDREKLKKMRNNAISSAQSFSKERWERDILKIIKEIYGEAN